MAVKREKVVQTAEKYVQRGKINAAIREYRKVLAEQPDDAMTLNRVGDLYARSNQIDEAIGLFTQIAESYTADGFFPKATAIYKKIIKLDPTRLGVYEKLAELYHRQGLLTEARTQYQVLADYYLKHDNATSATGIYERMTEVDPDDPSLRVRLAELYQEQKLLDKAMAQYREIAQVMLDHGHPDEAEQVFLKALQVDVGDLDFIGEGVAKLRQAGADGAAARFLAKAVQENPEAAEIADRGAETERAAAATAATEMPAEPSPAAEAFSESAASAPDDADDSLGLAGEDVDLVLDLDDAEELPEMWAEERDAESSEQAAPTPPVTEAPQAVGPVAYEDHPSSGEITLEMDALALGLEIDAPDEPAAAAEGPDLATDPVMTDPTAGTAPGAPPTDGSIDADFLERTAAELHPQRIQEEEDLLTEAEVLVKYGLTEKATERLGELLLLNPMHLGGRGLLIRLHLDRGSYDDAAALATELAVDAGSSDAWEGVWEQLQGAGFERDGDGTVRAPGPEAEAGAAEAAAVGEAVLASFDEITGADTPSAEAASAASMDEAPAQAAQPVQEAEVEAPSAAEAPEVDPPSSAEPAAVTPPPPLKPRKKRRSVEDMLASLAAGVLPNRQRPAPAPAASEAPAPPEAPTPQPPSLKPPSLEPPSPLEPPVLEMPSLEPPSLEAPAVEPPPTLPPPAAATGAAAEPPAPPAEASPGWLESTVPGQVPAADDLFSDEDEFFDLAAELEEELAREGALEDGDDLLLETPREKSLEEIVEGFKKGVSENLSEEDHHTRFNLGIAYREMGLLDEAIGEFQVAAKSPELLVECCSMLGLSFLDKGLPELAVKWYRRGLEAPGLSEDEHLGLLYDLGNSLMAVGDRAEAHATFVDIYGTNSNYRDVVAKIEDTRPR